MRRRRRSVHYPLKLPFSVSMSLASLSLHWFLYFPHQINIVFGEKIHFSIFLLMFFFENKKKHILSIQILCQFDGKKCPEFVFQKNFFPKKMFSEKWWIFCFEKKIGHNFEKFFFGKNCWNIFPDTFSPSNWHSFQVQKYWKKSRKQFFGKQFLKKLLVQILFQFHGKKCPENVFKNI